MSFNRPGLPQPGHSRNEPEKDESLEAEGAELTEEGDLVRTDHPGKRSPGPEPNPVADAADVDPPDPQH